MNCEKPLSITITSTPTVLNIAYWNLNDVNVNANVDQVSGDPVIVSTGFPFGSSSSSVPALISRGVQWDATAFANGFDGLVYQQSNNIAYTGLGFSFAFWINIKSGPIAFTSDTALFTYYPNIGDLTFKMEWTGTPSTPGGGMLTLNASTFPFELPGLNAWHLCVLVMTAAGDISASIDGAPLTLLGNGGAMPAQPLATAQLAIHLNIIFAGGTGPMYLTDEVAFFSGTLSDAQVAYLYNGGAGQTYPLTLP